jgi:hypothetical protein
MAQIGIARSALVFEQKRAISSQSLQDLQISEILGISVRD